MTDMAARSLQCEGMPRDAAHLLALLQSICPADLSGGGSRADLLRELAEELAACGASSQSEEIGALHDQIAALIDAQYERAGGHQDWASTWLPLAILGSKNEPGIALEALAGLLGWQLHPRLQRVDLVLQPGKRGEPIDLELHLRVNTDIAMSESDFGRVREQLEPLGVKWRYSRATESLQIERPAVLNAPHSAELDMFLDGKAPEWVLMAVGHGIVDRVHVTYPMPMRPRTCMERVARKVVIPRPISRDGQDRKLADIMRLLEVPEGHWRCHLMQVGHAQEWAPVILEYLRNLDGIYRSFASDGGWKVEQTASVISRHLSLSPHLELFPAEVGIEQSELERPCSALAATFESRLGKAMPRNSIVLTEAVPSAALGRLGRYETVALVLLGAASSLHAKAKAIGTELQDVSHSPPTESDLPPEASATGGAPPDYDYTKDLPEVTFGRDLREKASEIIRKLQDDRRRTHAALTTATADLRHARQELDQMRAQSREAQDTAQRAAARATRRAALVLEALAVALEESVRFAEWLRQSHQDFEQLLFGWAKEQSASDDTKAECLRTAVSGFSLDLLRQVVSSQDEKSRSQLLGAFCYLVISSDALNDRALSESSASGLPLGLAEDLQLAVGTCAALRTDLTTWQKRIRDAIDQGDGIPLADDESVKCARGELERVTQQLCADKPDSVP